jgi:hypothetical protein
VQAQAQQHFLTRRLLRWRMAAREARREHAAALQAELVGRTL